MKRCECHVTKNGHRVTPLVTFESMSDRYASFTSSPLGKLLVKNLGLPDPVPLDRWTEGGPLVDGTVVTGGTGRLVDQVTLSLDALGISHVPAAVEGEKYKGLVFDATGIRDSAGLVALQEFFKPLVRSLVPCSRVVVLGAPPEQLAGAERVAQRAL